MKKLLRKLKRIEVEFETAGVVRKERLLKMANSTIKQLEKLGVRKDSWKS